MSIELDPLAGKQGGDESRRLAKFWLDQLQAYKDNSEQKKWVKRGETIVKRYRDERTRTDEDGQRHYNSLWANVQILLPALYGKVPLPVAERRFKDKDPTGRNAAQMLERGLRNEIEINGFNEAMEQAVSDYLLPGRGTVWVRYEPLISESISLAPEPQTDLRDAQGDIHGVDTETRENGPPDEGYPEQKRFRATLDEGSQGGAEDQESELEKLMDTGDRVVRESTPVDFIPWTDFISLPIRARIWPEVTAVVKRVYMSRDQMKRRFGNTIGKAIPLQRDHRGERSQNTSQQPAEQDKGEVYEIWSKEDETVYWVAEGYEFLCDCKEDPLKLENFFPCPRPLFANPTTTTLVPVPDYMQYQDQAVQVDELTQRVAMLTKSCKMAGLYNAAQKDIQRLFNESVENELIPVDDWAAFAEKGGIEGNWSLMPVKDIIGILNELMGCKQKQIEEMDRLTGINDIMRGTSDARETLGGVRIKSNSTGTRLTKRQNEVARFARDTLRIMADIMAQHFSPQSLIEVSGALYEEGLGPDDMPTLSQLQAPPPQPGMMAPPRPGITPPGPMAPPGVPSGPALSPPPAALAPPPGPMGAPPPAPVGQNVVPFRPPLPPGAPPPGMAMPPSAPQGLTGQVMPPLDPGVQAKFDALKRIAKAIQLLRDERLRGFRVDIEVDSTIYGDQAQDKQDRNQFVVSVTQFMQQAAMIGAQIPEAIPLLGKLLAFTARGHRIGRDLELAIEEFSDQAMEIAKQKQMQMQSKPDPEAQKANVELMKAQSQLGVQQIQAQSDKMRAQAEIQSTAAKSQAEQRQSQAEIQRQQIENQGEMANAQSETQQRGMDMEMQKMQMQIELIKLQIEQKRLEAAEAKPLPTAAAGGE